MCGALQFFSARIFYERVQAVVMAKKEKPLMEHHC